MTETGVEAELFQRAVDFIRERYPSGWGGAAVLRTAKGKFLYSVAIETSNAGAGLCIETGAICEAHKLNERVTHSICVVRDDEESPIKILTPCGICQERLNFWGDVSVGVTTDDASLRFIPLKGLQPYHWTHAYPEEELEHFTGE